MSKIAGFIIGGLEVIAGIVLVATGVGGPLGVELIIQGTLMIAAQGIADLTAPKVPARQAAEMTLQLGEQPRSALFGETFTAGSLVDAFDFGGKYGTDWEVLVIRLADHKCDSLTGFYVNDVWVPYVGDGVYPQFDTHHFELYFRSDTTNQPLPAIVTANGPGWSASDIGASGCDVVVAYLADSPTAKHPAWPGGRPHFGFVVKGALCYDPRLDDTVGGTGPHRWDDPSTREWSENPVVCRYNWVRGIYANDQVDDPTQLLIGRGLSAAEAPPANVFAPANLCDEAVGTGVRYRIAGPVYANQQFIEVEEMFAAATAGSIVTREGSVELEPGQSKSVVATFTDDDLLVGSRASWNERILSDSDAAWINTVVANYAEPTQQWQPHDAPVQRDTADLVADGGPREASLTLRLVKDVAQAQRIAEITRRLGRLWGRGAVTLGPRFCELEEGDWVAWQSDRRFGGGTVTFRIGAYSIDGKWQNTLTLPEIAAGVFDGATFDGDQSVVTVTPPPPDIGAPVGANWALAAVTLANGGVSVPALEVTGSAADDTSVSDIIVEYWKSDGVINPIANPDAPPWTMEGSHAPTTTKIDITSIQGGQVYYVAITYVVSGIYGDRLVLGPVTAASIDVTGQVSPLIDAAVGKLAWKQPVRAKTTAALPANTYANGASGVGATLTGTANGALAAQDGVTLVANDRLLVDHEATGSHNGIYAMTQVGDATHPYILTRAADADTAAELVNAAVKISEGAAFADQEWQCTTNAVITVGTTALTFAQASGAASGSITASGYTMNTAKVLGRGSAGSGAIEELSLGAGLVLSGTTLSTSGGAGGGALTRISQQILVAAAASIDFSGIPATYEDLIIVLSARSTAASASDGFLRFNGDSGANYDYSRWNRFGNSSNVAQTSGAIASVPASNAPAGNCGQAVIEIVNYKRTTFRKSWVGTNSFDEGTVANNQIGQLSEGLWRNTAAINEVTLLLGAGNFDIGTVATLYGRG